MIDFQTHSKNFNQWSGDAIVLFAHADLKHPQYEQYIRQLDPKLGKYLQIQQDKQHIIIIHLGDGILQETNYHKGLKIGLDILKQTTILSVLIQTIDFDDTDAKQAIQNAVVFIASQLYQVKKPYLDDEPQALQQISLTSDNTIAIKNGVAIAKGQSLCRQLGDLPSNICTPNYLADTAQSLAANYGLDCKILEEKEMTNLGMNSLLSVSKGSDEPAKLITLSYQGDGNTQPIALVGKGVTFDSGGISLKPSAEMDEMKYDMCGAASVLGVMKTIAILRPKINVVMVVPSVENMPSSRASKPGDIVKSLDGQTIEILNTDAEGRLILCDAITYTQQQFKPKAIIDVATLTGAIIVALGRHYTGAISNNDALIATLKEAGKQSGDGIWQLPIAPEYDELIKSNFADMANIGNREAGSITAACFLSRFIKDNTPWTHLDIAGSAWNSGKNKGATGRPVALLTQYLLNNSKDK